MTKIKGNRFSFAAKPLNRRGIAVDFSKIQ